MAKAFEELILPRKTLSAGAGGYKIYKDAREFIVVAANTVQEALESSGITDAIRVERNLPGGITVLDAQALADLKTEEAQTPPPAEPVAEAAAPKEEAQPSTSS